MNLTYVTPGTSTRCASRSSAAAYFTDGDGAARRPVIVVNQAFVAPPLARSRIRSAGRSGRRRRRARIVGIVGDIQQKAGWGNYGAARRRRPRRYIPAAQTADARSSTIVHTWFAPSWFVRLRGPQAGDRRRDAARGGAVDPLLPFAKFRTIDEVRGEAVATQRAQAVLLATLAGLALLLAAVGLYGLVANTRRGADSASSASGIALGASSRSGGDARRPLPGLALASRAWRSALALARLGSSTLQHLVWGVSVADPLTFAVAVGTVLGAAIAALVPALRIVR